MANYAFNSFLREGGGGGGGGGGRRRRKCLLYSIAELILILKVHKRADSEPYQE